MMSVKLYANGYQPLGLSCSITLKKVDHMEMSYHNEIKIPVGRILLTGDLIIPLKASGLIVFSHGSGSSRLSPRNKMVADYLHQKKFATLLFDLLTTDEDKYYQNRFDIELLTKRLIGATEWIKTFEPASHLPIGYFGASTGAASALKAAAYLPNIQAIVSRGGRPDLAFDVLDRVETPTLLIVGSLDYDVLQLNKQAYNRMTCKKRLELITGAGHLFEEPGTMDLVCEKAATWFQKYLLPVETF